MLAANRERCYDVEYSCRACCRDVSFLFPAAYNTHMTAREQGKEANIECVVFKDTQKDAITQPNAQTLAEFLEG